MKVDKNSKVCNDCSKWVHGVLLFYFKIHFLLIVSFLLMYYPQEFKIKQLLYIVFICTVIVE